MLLRYNLTMQHTNFVRKITQSDIPNLITFWQSTFPNDPPHNAPELVLTEKLKVDDLVFVYEKQTNEIAGACMAGYDGHRGWLYSVAVASKCRREGVGRMLIEHAMSELKQLGCKKVNLQIRADNYAVEAFYQSLGFVSEPRLSMGKHI